MTERGHDRDTLQCRVRVKELQNAYHKAREAKRCSGAAPMSCRFYKELDVILGGDPTSTAKTTEDILVARVPVESGPSQEEEILDEDVEGEGDPEAEDDSEARYACREQRSELGKAQTGEEAPEMTLGAQPPSLLSPAERLRRIRKRPGKTKEDFLREVMMHSTLQAILALQTKQLRARPPLQPLLQNSFPCAPQTPPTDSY
nr:zinc finger and SCAN domain-containing protein 29-like [Chrysemys picta bellii]